ncbi:MAG TPA: ABC transporter ATP-binding protein [Acidimicrobiia bacterium]
MSEPEPVLELENLQVRYGAVPAVHGIDLTIGEGEVVGLIGPNGAGKSSTLAAVMGLVPPSRGDIRYRGKSIIEVPTEQRAALGLALVPEGRHIFPEFSVDENLRLGLLGRRDREGSNEALETVFELFPITREFRRRTAGELSGGQQQQLAIARALVSDPDVLLLDEPSLGLAPRLVETMIDALGEIRRRGVTILLVEQRAQLTVAFADRTYAMRDGRIVLTLTPEDAQDIDRLTSAYFGT